jgi:outer membrane cobalamin receptor
MNHPYTHLLFMLLYFMFCVTEVSAQAESTEDISLEELQNLKATTEASELQKDLNENVAASSKKGLASRETPGIVSVITAEEIRHLGARDLIDVLRIVPGFEFATDVEFIVGVGLRGNWAYEGKVLVMVDGQEYNEILFQTVPFGNKFPVDQIERIEIIRGPGSSIYGGTAEYGVVNIITKGNSGLDGVSATASYGFLPDTYGRKNIGTTLGKSFGEDFHADISVFRSEAIRSDQPYQDLYQEEDAVDLKEHSATQATNVNLGLQYKHAKVRAIYDAYHSNNPTYAIDFNNTFISAQNAFKLGKKITLTPLFSYTHQIPWEYTIQDNGENDYKIAAQRTKANVTGSYDITRKINIVAGSEFFYDQANSKQEDEHFGEGINSVQYNNVAFFAQGLFKHHFANFTLGFRYDKHNAFGAAFVPRLAITKRIDHFHFKVLYSQSYRAPGIENINLNDAIKPERSNIAELEAGYQFTPDMLLAVNAYKILTKDVIIYNYIDLEDGDYREEYANFDKTGTSGIEAVYKIKKPNWYTNITYSFYRANAGNTVETYEVAPNPRLFVAFPAHKFTFNGSFKVLKGLRFNPSLVYGSERYAYNEIDGEETPVLNRFAPYTLANLYISYDLFPVQGLTLGVGAYDIFNEKEPILQAYNGDFAPISGRSREITLKLSYDLSFKK